MICATSSYANNSNISCRPQHEYTQSTFSTATAPSNKIYTELILMYKTSSNFLSLFKVPPAACPPPLFLCSPHYNRAGTMF